MVSILILEISLRTHQTHQTVELLVIRGVNVVVDGGGGLNTTVPPPRPEGEG